MRNQLLVACITLASASVYPSERSEVGYASVTAARADLKGKPGVWPSYSEGFDIYVDGVDKTVWWFTKPGNAAHPAVVKRTIIEEHEHRSRDTKALCEGKQGTCEHLLKGFSELDSETPPPWPEYELALSLDSSVGDQRSLQNCEAGQLNMNMCAARDLTIVEVAIRHELGRLRTPQHSACNASLIREQADWENRIRKECDPNTTGTIVAQLVNSCAAEKGKGRLEVLKSRMPCQPAGAKTN